MNLKDTYNKIAESWHDDHKEDTWWQEGTDIFAQHIPRQGSILDVGCGGGTMTKYLTEKGFKVSGVDFSENFIKIAKEKVPGAKFLVMDIHDIDKLEENFDGIYMQAVLLHIPKKEVEEILRKAVQKLNPGGYVYIAVKEKFEGGVDEEVKTDDDYGYEYQRFFSYFTQEEFQTYFNHVGLELIYKDVKPPSRTRRQSNWMQIIGKKVS